jgi:hypothetical protein
LTREGTEAIGQTSQRAPQKPFARLVRHCIERILHGGGDSSSDELDFGIATMLGLLAMPGAFATIFLLDKYGSFFRFLRGEGKFDAYAASLPDEYFFIVLAMVVTGAVAIWKWDSLIPDHRDYANLAPLPISSRNIFLANLTALLLLTGVLALDVNAASSVLFPLMVCGSESSFAYLLVFLGTHLLSVVLASIFSFFVVLAILGLLMTALPYRLFRACSVYVRCAMAIFLMALLSTSFAMVRFVQNPSAASQLLMKLVSPLWFLGLCQSLRGVAGPAFASLGRFAVVGFATALILAVGAYTLSYRRCFTQSAEAVANLPSTGGVAGEHFFRSLDKLFLKTPFERACFRFSLRTLSRSESHALIVGGFTGLGIVLASQTLFEAARAAPHGSTSPSALPSVDLLSVPLILGYFLLLGVRFAFDIPVLLRANWIFRFTVNPETGECVPLARKIMLTFLIPLLLIVCLPVCVWRWGWSIGVTHTAIVAVLCLFLTEILLVRFRKIPFTCAAPAFKSSALVTVVFYFLGFAIFTSGTSTAERWALEDPLRYLVVVPALAGAWLILRRYRGEMTELDTRLTFVEQPDTAVEVLDLTFRR